MPPQRHGAVDVVVVGSLNVDYRVEVPHRPSAGETVLGADVQRLAGGKGANQAVAVAHAGGAAAMIGCAGEDADGDLMLEALAVHGVDVGHVARVPGHRTGNAFIFVTPDGENTIVVAPGANHRVDARAALAAVGDFGARAVLMQGELSVETTTALLAGLADRPERLVVNLAPAMSLAEGALAACDTLIVNAGEAAQVLGVERVPADDAEDAAVALRERAARVVITLGPRGAVGADADGPVTVPAPRVEVVDTTGAGDAFAGALALRLARGDGLPDALPHAVAAGAQAVGYAGAQPPVAARDA